ncbi:MAG TPA: DsrE family protein [Natrialbaceae archaeon]|nr:DsrE family protein [Natrialbaceae archaeon]
MSDLDTLAVLWTRGDKEFAEEMAFMYTLNAKKHGWWENVRLIVWGPSSPLLAEDDDLQELLAEMDEEGVVLEACRACAENYGVAEDLADLGITVEYMGEPLTEYLKDESTKVVEF